MASKYADDSEMDQLTEQERAALEEQDAEAEAASDDKGSPGEDKADPPAAEELEEVVASAEEKPAVEAVSAVIAENASDDKPVFAPRMEASQVDDYEKQQQELTAKFEEGDLTLTEYNTQRDTLLESKIEARIADNFNTRVGEQVWKHEQDLFFGQPEHAHYRPNKVLMAAIGAAVEQVSGDEKNAGRGGLFLLNEAHKLIASQFIAPGNTIKTPLVDKPLPQRMKKPDAPKTLSGLPASAIEEPGKDEFADLEKLTGDAYEEALARMPAHQQARYLHS